jgi:predicted ATPase/DNA-binding winged helix-turn-helix (wHTH) protein
LDETNHRRAYRIGRITIYPYYRLVFRDGKRVKVGSTLLNILIYLAENTGVVLTKGEIVRGSWLKINVSERNISYYISQARTLIGDENSIATIFNNGYKVVAQAEFLSDKDAVPPGPAPVPRIVRLHRTQSPLTGRDVELAELTNLVRDYVLITLAGPGGIGKTRLAIELGWRVGSRFGDGVVMVDLAPLSEAGALIAVATALAQALDLPLQETATPLETIADQIGDRQILLTLDNCEHLNQRVVEIIRVLRERAPAVTILATSQHLLDGIDQQIYRLKGLAVPPEGMTDPAGILNFDAVKLFVERAHAGDRRFVYGESNSVAVAEICRRLDGIPLSLKMAATQVRFFKIEGLRKRLHERFDLLRMDPGTAVKRHISLQDMTEWSYDLLEPAEQAFFCRLGVFPGWFSAAEAVAIAGGDLPKPLDQLRALEKKSLLESEENGEEEPSYRLLETLRIYATAQLAAKGERKLSAERHLRYFQDLFAQIEAESETTSDSILRQIYAPQIANVRAALDTALTEPELVQNGINLAGNTGRLWYMLVLVPEGNSYFDRFIPLIDKNTPPSDAARLLKYAGSLRRHTDRVGAVTLLKRAATIYRKAKDRPNLGSVMSLLGGNYIYLGMHEEAKAALDEAWKTLSGTNHIKSLQNIMNDSGNLALIRNDIAEAVRCRTIAADMAEQMKDILRQNIALFNLGELEFRRGAIDQAIECAWESASNLRTAGEYYQLARPLTNLAAYLTIRGDHAESRRCAEEALPLLIKERGHWLRLHLQLWAGFAALAGQYAEAAQLIGWVDGEQARTKEIREPTEQAHYDMIWALLTANVKPDDLAAWTSRGARWSEEYTVDYTLRRIVSSGRSNLLSSTDEEPSGSRGDTAGLADSGA